MDIELLKAQHEELEQSAAALLEAVSSEARQSIAPLRWRFARLLIAHLAVEDRFFYPRIIAGDDTAAAQVALRFQQEMAGLSDMFSQHMAKWTDDLIGKDWSGYSREVKDILARLQQRIDRENRELYTLMEGIAPDDKEGPPVDGRARMLGPQ